MLIYYNNRALAPPATLATWSEITVGFPLKEGSKIKSAAYGNGTFILAGSVTLSGQQWPMSVRSTDNGVTWSSGGAPGVYGGVTKMAFGNGIFVGVNAQSTVYSTDNGVTWSAPSHRGMNSQLVDLKFINGEFVALNALGRLYFSPDGETWALYPTIANTGTGALAYFNGYYYIGSGQYIGAIRSTDPRNVNAWEAVSSWPTTEMFAAEDRVVQLIYRGGEPEANNGGLRLRTFTNGSFHNPPEYKGVIMTQPTVPNSGSLSDSYSPLYAGIYAHGGLYVVGDHFTIAGTVSGTEWVYQKMNTSVTNYVTYRAFAASENKIIVAGDYGRAAIGTF